MLLNYNQDILIELKQLLWVNNKLIKNLQEFALSRIVYNNY